MTRPIMPPDQQGFGAGDRGRRGVRADRAGDQMRIEYRARQQAKTHTGGNAPDDRFKSAKFVDSADGDSRAAQPVDQPLAIAASLAKGADRHGIELAWVSDGRVIGGAHQNQLLDDRNSHGQFRVMHRRGHQRQVDTMMQHVLQKLLGRRRLQAQIHLWVTAAKRRQ